MGISNCAFCTFYSMLHTFFVKNIIFCSKFCLTTTAVSLRMLAVFPSNLKYRSDMKLCLLHFYLSSINVLIFGLKNSVFFPKPFLDNSFKTARPISMKLYTTNKCKPTLKVVQYTFIFLKFKFLG